jgi:FMN phosphatase YigB (HAD superfamily)
MNTDRDRRALFDRLDESVGAVSFDLFGTLVTVDRPPEPEEAVAAALRERDVPVPADWSAAYRTAHVETEPLAELPLHEHVVAALRSRTAQPDAVDEATVREAVQDAFHTPLATRPGAAAAIEALAERVPVGVLSNSSVEGLVERTIDRSDLPGEALAVVRASVEIGWRKPHERAFRAVAADLGVDPDRLLHVGDDPRTDGAAERVCAGAVLVDDEGPLDLGTALEEHGWLQ